MIYVSLLREIWGGRAPPAGESAGLLDAVHPDDLNSVREGILHQQRGEYFIATTGSSVRRPDPQGPCPRLSDPHSAGVVYRIGGLARDITRQQEMEADRILHERAQVLTLVREVHHRIKNHLQGVVGLLDEHASRFPLQRRHSSKQLCKSALSPWRMDFRDRLRCGIAPLRNRPGRCAIGCGSAKCIGSHRGPD